MNSKIEVRANRHEVYADGKEVILSPKEWGVFNLLRDRNVTISRNEIIAAIWGKAAPDSRTVDQHVARIRSKFRIPVIKTVPSRGYKYIG